MSYDDDPELAALKQRRAEQIQQQMEQQKTQEKVRAEVEAQKRALLQQILEEPALDRLANIKMVKPQLAESIEAQLITLAQSGRIQSKITDEQLKSLLARTVGSRSEGSITFKRK